MSKNKLNTRYCQSCGIPLDISGEMSALFYNPEDNGYCLHCWKDEEYKSERSLSGMIDLWVDNTNWYNDYAGTNYSPEELRAVFSQRLPTLSRWKQQAETGLLHEKQIGKVTSYLQEHLFEDLDMEKLLAQGGMSEFHLRKVFKKITGENIASYRQRLRIEYAAHLLLSTSLTLDDIADRTRYRSKHSLAKAFKKHFGVSTSQYKKQHASEHRANISECFSSYEIKNLSGLYLIYLEAGKAYRHQSSYRESWARIFKLAKQLDLDYGEYRLATVSLDDPSITPPGKCRFLLGMMMSGITVPEGKAEIFLIPDGRYAVFRHTGSLTDLPTAYRKIYEQLLPDLNYRIKNTMSFEIYTENEFKDDPQNVTTEIYIPVEKIPRDE